jgi:hypothetical protein
MGCYCASCDSSSGCCRRSPTSAPGSLSAKARRARSLGPSVFSGLVHAPLKRGSPAKDFAAHTHDTATAAAPNGSPFRLRFPEKVAHPDFKKSAKATNAAATTFPVSGGVAPVFSPGTTSGSSNDHTHNFSGTTSGESVATRTTSQSPGPLVAPARAPRRAPRHSWRSSASRRACEIVDRGA